MDEAGVRKALGLVDPLAVAGELIVEDERHEDGYVRQRVTIPARDGEVIPAYLLLPESGQTSPAVLVHHQHASEWHLGKSEVVGLAGDPNQAFGPALARAGVGVLAADSIGFEDRRGCGRATDPHEEDSAEWGRRLTHRLVAGGTLAQKVLGDAEDAFLALRSHASVNADRVGVVGHSYGGNVAIFQAAADERIAFACVSGAAGTYREKLARGIGIDLVQVIPGIAQQLDIDVLLALVAPRPLFIVAGSQDKYAADVEDVIASVSEVYASDGSESAFRGSVREGGHALTPEAHDEIVAWLVRTAHC